MKTFIIPLFYVFFSLFFKQGLIAQSLQERNLALNQRSVDQLALHKKILNHYAPDFYHDSDFLRKDLQVLKPSEVLTDPFFDGDNDFSNNPANILMQVEDENGKLKSKYDLKPRVFSSIEETDTYYYLNYMTYHARDDTGDDAHGQDTETVLIAIKKMPGSDLGELEFLVTNSHGYPRIYAANENLENKMRARLKSKLNLRDRLAMELLYGSGIADDLLGTPTDRMAQAHHRKGRIQLDPRPQLFIGAGSHPIYKLNPEAWKNGYGEGYIYTCVPEGSETTAHCFPMRPKKDRIVGYSLRDLDELLPLTETGNKMFEGNQIDFSKIVGDGTIRLRKDIPKSIVRGENDKNAQANLPSDWTMKTGLRLAMPHLVHQFLQPENKEISDHYRFNRKIEYSEIKALPSELNCAVPKN